MTEEQKKTQEGFQGCCGGMPFGDMLKRMMEAKKSGSSFDCAEMMSQMMQVFCRGGEKKNSPPEKPKRNRLWDNNPNPAPLLIRAGRHLLRS